MNEGQTVTPLWQFFMSNTLPTSKRDQFKAFWPCDSIREKPLARMWADPFPVTYTVPWNP